MNAATISRHVPVVHPTHKLRLLLRREFWEHRGGFLWAPAVAGAIFLLFATMGIFVGEVAARRAAANGTLAIENGHGFRITGLDLGAVTSHMSAEDMRQFSGVLDGLMLMSSAWPMIVLGFVVFFYCLGTLYDERKDRSVLFWKSLPISDAETVLSKALSATVIAPALAVAASLATMLGFLIVLSAVALVHGANPFQLLWANANPLGIAAQLVASIPVFALWSLPTVGWLMLCSAWARSKPFLWAIMIPVFAGIFVSWFDLMQLFNLQSGWFWKNVVARILLSVAPGSWMRLDNPNHLDGPAAIVSLINLRSTWSTLLTPELWIGALAGAAMIFVAIRLRRWRDEG